MTRKLRVRPVKWSKTAQRHLAPALDDAIDWVRSMVREGRIVLFGVYLDRARLGTAAIRFQTGLYGKEALVLGCGGRAPSGLSLLRQTMPIWEEVARRAGANVLRAHTRKPAIARQLEYLGFDGGERAFTKDVAHG